MHYIKSQAHTRHETRAFEFEGARRRGYYMAHIRYCTYTHTPLSPSPSRSAKNLNLGTTKGGYKCVAREHGIRGLRRVITSRSAPVHVSHQSFLEYGQVPPAWAPHAESHGRRGAARSRGFVLPSWPRRGRKPENSENPRVAAGKQCEYSQDGADRRRTGAGPFRQTCRSASQDPEPCCSAPPDRCRTVPVRLRSDASPGPIGRTDVAGRYRTGRRHAPAGRWLVEPAPLVLRGCCGRVVRWRRGASRTGGV